MDIKLPKALDPITGKAVDAKEAVRGPHWQCPHCHARVVLKKGPHRIPHLTHLGHACKGAVETFLHHLCKQLIVENPINRIRRASGDWFEYSEARKEDPLGTRKIDVMFVGQNGNLAVEICVTHPFDNQKIADLRQTGCPALEIVVDLSDLDLTRRGLQFKLIHGIANKEDFDPLPTPVLSPACAPILNNHTHFRFDWQQILLGILLIVGVLVVLYKLLKYLLDPPKKKRPRPAYMMANPYSRARR